MSCRWSNRSTSGLFCPFFRIELQETQNISKSTQYNTKTKLFLLVLLRYRAIELPRHIKQHRDRLRRVEIVVHRCVEARQVIAEIDVHCRCAHLYIPQCRIKPVERRLGAVQILLGIIERAAIVAAQDEITHDFGLVAYEHVTHGKEISE